MRHLLTLFAHPGAAAAGALLNNDHHPSDNGFIMKTDQYESKQDLLTLFAHPVAAAAGALLNNDHHPVDEWFYNEYRPV